MNIYETWIVKQPIAHRGLFGDKIPENSIAAFKNAVKNKVTIDLDVSFLTDGTPVIFHDEKLARMTGKDGFISNCKYEDKIFCGYYDSFVLFCGLPSER